VTKCKNIILITDSSLVVCDVCVWIQGDVLLTSVWIQGDAVLTGVLDRQHITWRRISSVTRTLRETKQNMLVNKAEPGK